MKKQTLTFLSLFVISATLLSACNAAPALPLQTAGRAAAAASTATPYSPTAVPVPVATRSAPAAAPGLLAAYETTLEDIYAQVSPSVVSIRVTAKTMAADTSGELFQFPFQNSVPNTPKYSEGLGSGFVWDPAGHIVTNNHVVANADKIEVTFADGTTFPAQLVGTDANSDLAVIKVEGAADRLQPVQLADSTQVKVGELAIAIGNPFGLESTMTVGIVSALERTLSADVTNSLGPVYSIPDIIQTDAPINPGNSGGVLVNTEGQVMGVTAAIESAVNSNAGIGFAIPSNLVAKVVPALVKDQHYAHPYLGITGATLTLGLAQAMDLPVGQRGALVVSVVPQGPADQAGLRGSDKTATLDGQSVTIGGDVITAINGQPIAKMDDLIAYLADQTEVGQSVTLTVLRGGQAISLTATLAARPEQTETSAVRADETQKGAWLGILGADLTPAVAQAMDLDKAQTGILIQQIEAGSPADKAGLQGSTKSVTTNGQRLSVGGDIITAIDGQPVTRLAELQQALQTHKAGAEVQLTILRAGATTTISVTLAERSAP